VCSLCVACCGVAREQTATLSLIVHARAASREYKALAEQMETIWRIHNINLRVAGASVVAGQVAGTEGQPAAAAAAAPAAAAPAAEES
jgi:hypothetical protein